MSTLPDWAEDYVSLQCSDIGAIATRPKKDVNGWDFHVEFAAVTHQGSPDTTPPIRAAYVQVKSTTGLSAQAEFRLSNLIKAANSPSPWFILLIQKHSEAVVVRGQHVWHDQIFAWLQEAKKSGEGTRKPNRVRVIVKFSDEDRIEGNLAAWMTQHLDAIGPDYATPKNALSRDVGFEKGRAFGHLVIEASSSGEISKALLGFKSNVRVKSFTLTSGRFGVPDKSAAIDTTEGTIQFTPDPVEVVSVSVRGSPLEPALNLNGALYRVSISDSANPLAAIRVSSPPMELFFDFFGDKLIRLVIEPERPYTLRYWHNLCRIGIWCETHGLSVTIRSKATTGELRYTVKKKRLLALDAKRLIKCINMLMKLERDFTDTVSEISLNDINAASTELQWLDDLTTPTKLHMTEQIEVPPVGGAHSIIYYSSVTLGRWSYAALISRPILEVKDHEDYRRTYCGGSTIVESYVTQQPMADLKVQLADREVRAISDMADGVVIQIGDIHDRLKAPLSDMPYEMLERSFEGVT